MEYETGEPLQQLVERLPLDRATLLRIVRPLLFDSLEAVRLRQASCIGTSSPATSTSVPTVRRCYSTSARPDGSGGQHRSGLTAIVTPELRAPAEQYPPARRQAGPWTDLAMPWPA